MKRYEYLSVPSKILLPENIHELNSLGAQGWELVLCEPCGNAVFKRKSEEKEKEKSCKTCKYRLAYKENKAQELAQCKKTDNCEKISCDKDNFEKSDKCC